MADQGTFADLAWAQKGKVTRREQFLAEMNAAVPWRELVSLIEPHYPKVGNGRPPLGLEKMLRIHFLQQWFNLSDPSAEDALYDSESMRRFVGISLGEDVVPDESSILRFRHLLEEHDLSASIFDGVRGLLESKGVLVKSGTIVDATIISAPSSTKNRSKSRDPEMKQGRSGKTWHFGMKVHVGSDKNGLAHSITTTDAGQSEIKQLPKLLHGDERQLHGDQAYWSGEDRKELEKRGIRYRVNRRRSSKKPLSEYWKKVNRARSRTRARGEHIYNVVKNLWHFRKVRYRGLAKNTSKVLIIFALANLYLARKRLKPARA